MKHGVILFGYGLLFGIGLVVAGMSNPANVLAFLDVAGAWDPSLALVMASALATLGGARHWLHRNTEAADHEQDTGAAPAAIDARLVCGAAIFGVGWGISGFCPGPALVGLTAGLAGNYVFVAAMFAGFYLFKRLHRSN
ncbi:YeeE/YedE family protein [Methylomonas sp. EFPC3]|uniref:DUF6691 family protein n=1 Tax=Methylomonas sp. EFPC3 TaxID=3021710 RepID=UPI002416DAAC|nr:DUF6691 family protein [Methylomonas sp. EFPC3]WFP50859.1 YeeE/YedE family protein [Methylomonas sp. EFPC3]